MPHTKSDHNIQVRLRLVQKLCLQDRITHIHTDTFAAFRDADRCLLLCSGFTADTIHLKAMSAQDICQDTAFFQQSDTGCDPDLFRINLLCKIHDFFDTGMFAVGFMAVGGLVNLAVLLFQGWEPVGFWTLFGVGIEEGLIMWVGALPCILLVVLLNKNYIVSVVITFFYTTANYILSMSDAFLTQPFGLNIGTLFPGPLAFRWTFQFYDQSQTSAELADLLERISPYFLNGVQVFGVIVGEAVVFLALIALVYRRQEI